MSDSDLASTVTIWEEIQGRASENFERSLEKTENTLRLSTSNFLYRCYRETLNKIIVKTEISVLNV